MNSFIGHVKIKYTLIQALRLCTGRTSHRGSRGIALLFHDHGTRRGWGDSVTPLSLFTPGKNPVSIVQEAGWAPGPVWTGAENLAPPPGFDPRTVRPVASRYTDYATWPTQDRVTSKLRLFDSFIHIYTYTTVWHMCVTDMFKILGFIGSKLCVSEALYLYVGKRTCSRSTIHEVSQE